MPSRGQKWTIEQTDRLRALHEKGMSCALMAAELACGFTRNAVIGRLNRLGLSNASSTIRKVGGNKRPKKVNRKTIRIVRANGNSDRMRFMESPETDMAELRCTEVEMRGIALVDLEEGDCRYPDGDGPFTFCGHPKLEGASYCGPHYALTRTGPRNLSDAVREQRRRTIRTQFKLSLMEATL